MIAAEGSAKPRTHRRGAYVRKAVLAATLEELAEHGVSGLTIAAVAARAGVHETSVYRRWRTKQQLILDALLDRSATVLPVPDTGSIRGDLVALLRSLADYLASPIARPLLQTAALSVTDESLSDLRRTFIAAQVQAMAVPFKLGKERGELSPDTDPHLVLELLVAPLYLRVLLTGEPLEEDLPERLVDAVMDGLCPR